MRLRKLVNELINNMPEPLFACPVPGCCRKIKEKDKFEAHMKRHEQ